jgi:hypothetical protein
MPKLSRALALLPALALSPSHAGVHWLCGLADGATQLVCVADVDPLAGEAAISGGRQPATAAVRGTRFPLDPGRAYTVDFWSPATDMAHVEQLARATMCYRSPGCSVSFTPAPAPRSPVRAALKAG